MSPFLALGLSAPACRALAERGYVEPTPIQAQTVPILLSGADLIAQAHTGTGKTAAFALPILHRLLPGLREPQALVLAPTRELAVQVAESFSSYGKFMGVSVLAVYGGQPISTQLRPLHRGVQVVVGTPGRILDHIRRGTLKLGAVRSVVLDEADEMLDMGFMEDIETILKETPAERQTAFFSATLPAPIVALGRRYLRDPQRVTIRDEAAAMPDIRQVYYDVGRRDKFEVLVRLLQHETPVSTIVFCRTREDADGLSERLSQRELPAEPLHGDLRQAQRDRVIARFKAGDVGILTATDVAARGLDIEQVSHVINYDLPMDPGVYIHRIGRTGRAGRSGCAMTLLGPGERRRMKMIEQLTGKAMERVMVPTLEAVAARRHELFKETLLETLAEEAGAAGGYRALAQEVLLERDPAEVLAAAFRLLLGPAGSAADDRLAQGEPRLGDDRPARRPVRPTHHEGRPEYRDSRGDSRNDRGESRPEYRNDNKYLARQDFRGDGRGDARGDGRGDGRTEPATDSAGRGGTRLFLNIGREDGVRPADLVGAIANEAGIPGRTIGPIELFGRFSFVEVPSAKAGLVMEALRNTLVRGRKVAPSLARPA